MKKFTKVVEAYEMEIERHEDFAEEHAKVVISNYIDNKLKGKTLQDAFNELADDMLVGMGDNGPQEMTIQAIEKIISELSIQSNTLKIREVKNTEIDDESHIKGR